MIQITWLKKFGRHSMYEVGFIGLGKLGMPCAQTMASHSLVTVKGYDIKERHPDNFEMCELKDVVRMSDFIFIAVETPHSPGFDGSCTVSGLEPRDFSYWKVRDAIDQVNQYISKGQTIVLISTVLPGTQFHMKEGVNFIYNPYLIAMGSEVHDFINPEMIIMGGDKLDKLKAFYSMLCDEPRFETGTIEEAQCIKIFYNTFISAKLGIVNTIQDVAERLGGVNVDVVTGALARSDYRITSDHYMKAGMGDGGPCHPRDNIALSHLAKKLELNYDLFGSITYAREMQARNMAKKIVGFNLPVSFLGKSYKPGVDITDGSYAMLIAHFIQMMSRLKFKFDDDFDEPQTYVLCHDKEYDYPFKEGSVIFDPWRRYKNPNFIVVHYGTYTD